MKKKEVIKLKTDLIDYFAYDNYYNKANLYPQQNALAVFFYDKTGHTRMFENTNFNCKGIVINNFI